MIFGFREVHLRSRVIDFHILEVMFCFRESKESIRNVNFAFRGIILAFR